MNVSRSTKHANAAFLTRAIALDPAFEPAYELRANALYDIKEYRQAIRDFDRVLELANGATPRRIAYNDRGLAKSALGEYHIAIRDFSSAIALGCEDLCQSYQNRADAYRKLRDYNNSITDISSSIRQVLSDAMYLMNIEQFRRIYPEYDSVADNVLCEKLRTFFYPYVPYSDFAKAFLIEPKKYSSTILPDLYIKRGDAYAAMNQLKLANIEYDRVSRAFPDSAAIFFIEKDGKRIRRQND